MRQTSTAISNTTLHFGLAVSLGTALAGCAILPMAAANLAAQGATGLVALSLGPMVDMQERSATDRCAMFTGKGFSVAESFERVAPTGEGEPKSFEPALWRPEFAREGYPQVEQSRTPTEGMLVVTERSVSFVPPLGGASVRIPYELVQDVELRGGVVAGEPRSVIVKSCYGRFDIVTFPQSSSRDPETTTEAAVNLKARLAAFRTAASN